MLRCAPASSSRRLAACALCVAVLLAVAGGIGAPAAFSAGLSGSGALSELTEGQPETTSTATTTTSTTENENSSSNSKSVILLAGGIAVVLLLGIAFVIVRDARRVAPAGDVAAVEATSAHDLAVRARKRRAKAKAARQQRKRNRSR